MKRILLLFFVALCAAAQFGCKPSSTDANNSAAAPSGHQFPTEAQAKLPTVKLWLGPKELIAEMALTPRQNETGLMFRTNLAENEGMIFPFGRPVRASFWMKNTILPLSVAYIAPNGAILEIHDMQPQDTNAIVAATGDVQYALETRQGWFKRNGIGIGTVVATENGPLQKVFVAR